MRIKNMLLRKMKMSIMTVENVGGTYYWIVILSVGNILIYIVVNLLGCVGVIKRLYVLEVFLLLVGECD